VFAVVGAVLERRESCRLNLELCTMGPASPMAWFFSGYHTAGRGRCPPLQSGPALVAAEQIIRREGQVLMVVSTVEIVRYRADYPGQVSG
jgi:hypothetical protein